MFPIRHLLKLFSYLAKATLFVIYRKCISTLRVFCVYIVDFIPYNYFFVLKTMLSFIFKNISSFRVYGCKTFFCIMPINHQLDFPKVQFLTVKYRISKSQQKTKTTSVSLIFFLKLLVTLNINTFMIIIIFQRVHSPHA